MEDAARDVAGKLLEQGMLGVVVLLLIAALAFAGRVIVLLFRLLNEAIVAKNEVNEKRVAENRAAVEAINSLEKREDLLLRLIRDKGIH